MTEPPLASAARVSWFAAASRGRLRVTLAAILLMLHWAMPTVSAFQGSPGQAETGYSTAQYGAAPGTLPRLMTRSHSVEAGQNGPQRSDDPPAEKAKAFHVASLPVAPATGCCVSRPAAPGPQAPTLASFEARGPPSPRA